jgi:hypothetical protein
MDGNVFRPAGQRELREGTQTGRWTLRLDPSTNPNEGRSQLAFVEAALAQYDESRLEGLLIGSRQGDTSQPFSQWPLERARVVNDTSRRDGPLLALISPSGTVAHEWQSFVPPAELGLALRRALGAPRGSPAMVPD